MAEIHYKWNRSVKIAWAHNLPADRNPHQRAFEMRYICCPKIRAFRRFVDLGGTVKKWRHMMRPNGYVS